MLVGGLGGNVGTRLSGESEWVSDSVIYSLPVFGVCVCVCVCVKTEKERVHLLKLLAVDPTSPSQTW